MLCSEEAKGDEGGRAKDAGETGKQGGVGRVYEAVRVREGGKCI